MYREITKTWQRMSKNRSAEIKSLGIMLRTRPTIERVDRPTRLDRARRLGYKAKPGFIIVRIKVSRGGMRRVKAKAGRRQKHAGIVKMKANVNVRQTSERRVSEKFPNLEVLNSYFVYRDGRSAWYEVILVDKCDPSLIDYMDLAN